MKTLKDREGSLVKINARIYWPAERRWEKSKHPCIFVCVSSVEKLTELDGHYETLNPFELEEKKINENDNKAVCLFLIDDKLVKIYLYIDHLEFIE